MSEPAPAASEAEARHPGALLGQARTALGISRADIAASLYLEEELVAALEAGRNEDLPAATYVRGYVRAYARLVGLEPEQLVRRLDGAQTRRSERPMLRHVQERPSFAQRTQRHVGLLLGGIVVAMLIAGAGVLWWVWRSAEWPFVTIGRAAPATADPALVAIDNAGIDVGATVAPPPAEAWPATPPDPDRLAVQNAALLTTPPAPGDAPPVPPAATGTVPADLPIAPAPADLPLAMPSPAADALAFRFSDDCWVEVRDADGAIVYADLARAGQTLALGGKPPFSIQLGYAAGVELRYEGQPVALAPHTQGNVARLMVGH